MAGVCRERQEARVARGEQWKEGWHVGPHRPCQDVTAL